MAFRLRDFLNPRRERVTNGGFEEGVASGPNTDLFAGNTELTGWVIVDCGDNLGGTSTQQVTLAGGDLPAGNAASGKRFVNLAGYGAVPPRHGLHAGVTQRIETIPGATHRLTLAVGTLFRQTNPEYQGPVRVRAYVTGPLAPADIPAKLPPATSDISAIFLNASLPDLVTPGADKNVWTRHSFDFTPKLPQTQLTIYGLDSNADRANEGLPPEAYMGLDDVSVRVTEGPLTVLWLGWRSFAGLISSLASWFRRDG